MTNPFDEPDGRFVVLRNEEGQHSLWPTFADPPSGWEIVHAEDSRAACLAYVEANWRSLTSTMIDRPA
jgi:MbtH protein